MSFSALGWGDWVWGRTVRDKPLASCGTGIVWHGAAGLVCLLPRASSEAAHSVVGAERPASGDTAQTELITFLLGLSTLPACFLLFV